MRILVESNGVYMYPQRANSSLFTTHSHTHVITHVMGWVDETTRRITRREVDDGWSGGNVIHRDSYIGLLFITGGERWWEVVEQGKGAKNRL